ncbi:MAG: alpha-amylase family glycosyl hydrolase [Paludibacter sp.]|nr:alpha-amylase family glycosyl hydrolase [Bacteroidales bacterium]MCM1069094.1 alpha-amylase family glycosyl hydrolase [Prevotella sp.]MCM1353533.1 alpha-amylase family glycosyl hydrolase [Bacteroides sp.]MCM1442694.1 alpha-amylase family glycosyl hydrolase [Muribaculum sp.]MCM1481670.1 alpha-amylase family glycosyl hydrolase [Paludibacter sp.]
MKKTLLYFTAAIVFCSCGKQSASILQQTTIATPIQPIHLTADSNHIFLTDYLPELTDYNWDSVHTDGLTYIQQGDEADIYTDNTLPNVVRTLTFYKEGYSVSIPVLPTLAHQQGLCTYRSASDQLQFGFATVANNPTIRIYWQNKEITHPQLSQTEDGTYLLTLPDHGNTGRSFLRIYATDDNVLYNDLLIPLEDMRIIDTPTPLTRHDNHAQVLYSLMIDRFYDGNSANTQKLHTPEVLDIVDYQGGDFAGITQKIEEGFFDTLGITTLWISPITQNPYDAWGYYAFDGEPCKYTDINGNQPAYTKFSGYHGYWPIYITSVEKRFGTDEELRQLLATAHAHNMNVILDYVANHMHIASPTLQAHPDWVTDSILPDGRRNFELWDEQRLTTWFDVHIPTLDLERAEVYNPMTDSALYWLENFDFDGFRHDACKHIPECYWRTLTKKIKTRMPDRSVWMIGETYGSPELISSYVKTGMLNAQFDFNIYHTAIDVFGKEGHSMKDIARVIEESLATYGAHHTMGNISGNHDKARFVSLAGGALGWDEDPKEAGWTRNIGIGDTTTAYKKALLLEVLNFTIPGVPCIYQGDEYAEAGANDPDNRHMMRFCGYNEQENDFREQVKELIALRRNNMCLIYGDYLPLYITDDVLCFQRIYLGEQLTIAINKSNTLQHIPNLNIDIEPLSYIISNK